MFGKGAAGTAQHPPKCGRCSGGFRLNQAWRQKRKPHHPARQGGPLAADWGCSLFCRLAVAEHATATCWRAESPPSTPNGQAHRSLNPVKSLGTAFRKLEVLLTRGAAVLWTMPRADRLTIDLILSVWAT
jgi:hypothetical protein